LYKEKHAIVAGIFIVVTPKVVPDFDAERTLLQGSCYFDDLLRKCDDLNGGDCDKMAA